MFCIYCGTTLPDDTVICPVCGNKSLVSEAEETKSDSQSTENTAHVESSPEETAKKPETNSDIEMEDVYSVSENDPNIPEESTEPKPMEDLSSGEKMEYEEEFIQKSSNTTPSYEDSYVYETYEEEEKLPKKRSLKWLWIVLAVVVALVAAGIAAYMWYTAPAQQLTRAMSENNYSKITEILPQFPEEELKVVVGNMKDYATDIVDRYNQGEVEYSEAYGLVERLSRLSPDTVEFQDAVYRMKALKASKDAFAKAQREEDSEKVENVLRLYNEVIKEDTNYKAAQERIVAVKQAYKTEVLEEAQKLAKEKDFTGAQKLLEGSRSILGEDADIEAKKEEIKKAAQDDYVVSLIETAKKMANEGDYLGAIQILQDAKEQDERFTAQIEIFRKDYKEKVMQDAANLAEQSEYEQAVSILENALNDLGDDDDIYAKIEEYEALYPVLLVNLSPTDGADCAENWVATDSNGNTYSNGLSFSMYPIVKQKVYTEYTPGGQYKRLSGTWVVEQDTTDGFVGAVRVYVDGSLQYELSSLTADSDPVDMNLLIEGAQTVRFEVEGSFTSIRQNGYIYLAGATFRN